MFFDGSAVWAALKIVGVGLIAAAAWSWFGWQAAAVVVGLTLTVVGPILCWLKSDD